MVYTRTEMVSQAIQLCRVRVRKAFQLEGFTIRVYTNGKSVLQKLFVWTVSFRVSIPSVRFIKSRATAEHSMDPNCNVHPMKSPRVNPASEEALERLMREHPTKEERTAGQSAGGSLVFKKRESPRDTKMGRERPALKLHSVRVLY